MACRDTTSPCQLLLAFHQPEPQLWGSPLLPAHEGILPTAQTPGGLENPSCWQLTGDTSNIECYGSHQPLLIKHDETTGYFYPYQAVSNTQHYLQRAKAKMFAKHEQTKYISLLEAIIAAGDLVSPIVLWLSQLLWSGLFCKASTL